MKDKLICKDEEMIKVKGGALKEISGAVLNALSTIWKTIYSIGQGMGGALRRIGSGKVCKL